MTPMIIVDVPVSLVQLIVIIIVVVPGLCVFATLETHKLATRYHDRWLKEEKEKLKEEKANLEFRKKLLDERKAIQLNRDNELRIREEALQTVRRTAKEATAAINEDTVISVMDREFDDTVQIPVVEDER